MPDNPPVPWRAPPPPPSATIELQQPPELVASDGISGMLTSMLPMLGSMGAIAMVALTMPGPRGYLTGGLFLLTSLGFVAVNGWRGRQQQQGQVLAARREYLSYLATLRRDIRAAADQQRAHLRWSHPDPSALVFLAEEGSRVWERSGESAEFLRLRLGRFDQNLCLDVREGEPAALDRVDPIAASAAHRLAAAHAIVPALPEAISLANHAHIQILGPDHHSLALARAMIAQAATFHSPEHLQIAILTTEDRRPQWEWAKWLPHTHSPRKVDGVGHARMICTDLAELTELLPSDLARRPSFDPSGPTHLPHILLITDAIAPPNEPAALTGTASVTVLDLPSARKNAGGPHSARLVLGSWIIREPHQADDDASHPDGPLTGTPLVANPESADPDADVPLQLILGSLDARYGVADSLSLAEAEATARRLMSRPRTLVPATAGGTKRRQAELTELLGLADVRDLDLDRTWRPKTARERLRVPIGQQRDGQPVTLDLKESAEGGMGPHGLIIGATGSGKSEVLRTLVLALAMTHSPEELNFVLVDFKGGATFAGMATMPHVSTIITNLADELALVDRMEEALRGEMNRRQELLRSAGNFAGVSDYNKARAGGRTDLPPMPALLIVCDEFSELLTAKSEFADVFVAIGRLGRSLHIHLLLSSQRLEGHKIQSLESHLSYRIGLRTFSPLESRSVLGVGDAYDLPAVPGVGYFKPDTATMIRFRAAYVSGPPATKRRAPVIGGTPRPGSLEFFTATPVASALASPIEPAIEPDNETRSTFQIAVQAMAGRGPVAHKVWLPPLEEPETLDTFMPDLRIEPGVGLISPRWRAAGPLTCPIGVVDRPMEQRREDYVAALTGASGHFGIVGGPRTGKSTAARTLICSLALTHSPLEVQFYVMDFGGGAFAPFADLAHVAGVATRTEPDIVRRMLSEVASIVRRRETYFRSAGIDSIETYRQRRARGQADDGYGDVFLVIDGWATVRNDFEDMEDEIQSLAASGLTYGMHLIVTANRWADFRSPARDIISGWLELRLGDESDSRAGSARARNVPVAIPGRGLNTNRHHVMAALPRIDGKGDSVSIAEGAADLIGRINAAYTGPRPPKLRLLPSMLTMAELRAKAETEITGQILLGVDESDLAAVPFNQRAEPHVYLLGDSGSGKTTFLRAMISEITRLNTPREAQVVLVDYRRGLLGEVPDEYLAEYVTAQAQAADQMAALASLLIGRLPGPDVTIAQLRDRSWWSGREVYLLIDDYDLVATSSGNPLAALTPVLPHARDIGLHVMLTRRIGGAARASYEPFMQTMRDLAAPAIMLAGSPDEGPLVGKHRPLETEPGRAQYIDRDGRRVLQLAYVEGR